jgi:GAF domain-containing protein
MSLTRKASSAAKKPTKPPRQDLAAALAEREAELAEARRQQVATAEILRVISQSPTDAGPVFERIVVSAARLLRCDMAFVLLREGGAYVHTAGASQEGPMVDLAPERFPIDVSANFPSRAFLTKTMLHLPDWSQIDLPEHERRIHETFGVSSALYLPLLREEGSIGVLAFAGKRANMFGPGEIAQAKSFRDQALIAMENARLFNETRQALEQQKASADVLGAISKSVADTAPVFEAIIDACHRLFGGEEIGIYTIGDDDMVRVAAWRGPRAEEVRHDVTPVGESITGRIIRERRTHHISDLRAEPNLSRTVRERVDRLGGASLLYAPMLWEESGLGSILVVRSPPKPFSERERALLQSFADQAAIAIQNARLFDEVQARTRDLEESLEQQTATADVLKAISRSAFNLETVLESLIATAARLCGTKGGQIFRRDGDIYRYAASQMLVDPTYRAHEQMAEIKAGRGTLIGRVALENRTVQITDAWNDPDYAEKDEARLGKVRAMLGVPLLRNGELIGAFALAREEPIPFTRRQVELVTTFADQAVIAIENVRLFDEVQAKTRDLEESLQQQTATADVLKAISRTAFDLDTVLQTLISTAVRLCDASGGEIFRRHGDVFRYAASLMDLDPAYLEHEQKAEIRAGRGTLIGRVAVEKRTVEIADAWSDPEYAEKEEVRVGGVRAMLGVPLMRNGELIGAFALGRPAPVPFTKRQVELVTTFADQAVIAIENVRLFDEVQAKTHDLEESLQQQTATADVLKVISRSAFDLPAVLRTLVESAAKLCDADKATITREVNGVYYRAESYGFSEEFMGRIRNIPVAPERGSITGRVMLEGKTIQVEDVEADPEYWPKNFAERGELRTGLGIPMMRNSAPIGVLALMRTEVRPFTGKQIELVQTFADQAVIAIENARLFDEVQARTRDLEEALAQQTATANVLKVISRSAFDLDAVLNTLTESARSLSGAATAAVFLRDGELFPLRAESGVPPEFLEYMNAHPARPGKATLIGRVAMAGEAVLIPDALADPDYNYGAGPQIGHYRALFGAPMIRDGRVEGVFGLMHPKPSAFMPRQMEMVRAFADQAVIAIENARLFEEVQARTRDLAESLEQQTAAAEILRVISSSPTDVQPVFDAIASSAASLCEATNGAVFRVRDGLIHLVGHYSMSQQQLASLQRSFPAPLDRTIASGRAILDRAVIHIADVAAEPGYPPALAKTGLRSVLSVPMLRNGESIGSINVSREAVRPFSDRQIELLKTFAEQAVIAINNVRLFDEVQTRTRDLTEALQQQTATAEVLKVISRSAFDLQAVLDTLTSSAVELSGASNGVIALREGDGYRYRAFSASMTPEFVQYLVEHPPVPGPGSGAGLAIRSGRIEQIPDVIEDLDYALPMPSLNRTRSILAVPLLRDDRIEGAFVVTGAEPGMFPQRQIDLIQTFADQAVIAIENVRLFDEVQARTRDLTEALQMQTATSDVLKVISRSAFDLQAVFNTLVSSAVELGGALTGTICVREGDVFRYRDTIGAEHTSALARYLRDHPAVPGRSTIAGRVLLSGKVERIPDCLADPDYVVPMGSLATNVRSLLGVPLLRKDGVEGAIILTRAEPGHFSDRQVEIVQTFADQAVIAIENVRLFAEVEARTKDLAASLDDLRKAQDRLIQSEKLASLGQLTAGIAHEIKNPLNFVNNFSALSRELVGELADVIKAAPLDDARRQEAEELITTIDGNLDKVVQHGKRADSIVKNMLLHSREGSGERATTNINAMVEEALNLAYHGARAEKPGFNVTIAKSLDPGAGAAEVYAQEMTRVLLNLISNGFYATAKRKQADADGAYEPTLTASTRDLGASVEIAIRDNGTGIPDRVKAKMFNPFFTTKPAGEGTGLGLSLSHDIVVKQHGGTIEVSTEPGYTRFTIVLPRAGPHPIPAPVEAGEGL